MTFCGGCDFSCPRDFVDLSTVTSVVHDPTYTDPWFFKAHPEHEKNHPSNIVINTDTRRKSIFGPSVEILDYDNYENAQPHQNTKTVVQSMMEVTKKIEMLPSEQDRCKNIKSRLETYKQHKQTTKTKEASVAATTNVTDKPRKKPAVPTLQQCLKDSSKKNCSTISSTKKVICNEDLVSLSTRMNKSSHRSLSQEDMMKDEPVVKKTKVIMQMGNSISTAQAIVTCTTKKKDSHDSNVSSNIPQKKNLVSKSSCSVSKLTENLKNQEDDIFEALREHNKKFSKTPAFTPNMYSVHDVRKWESKTGKIWRDLNPQERENANSEIAAMKEGRL